MAYRAILSASLAVVAISFLSSNSYSRDSKARSKTKPAVEEYKPPYRDEILSQLKSSLKDPYSVKSAGISTLYPGFVGIFRGGNKPVVCVRLNSKNGFGAYTGVVSYAFIIENEHVVGSINEQNVACANRSYDPFPELGDPT